MTGIRGAIPEAMHCASEAQTVLRFGQWMNAQPNVEAISFREVMAHFPVSRAVAYRWINAWRAVSGLPSLHDARWLHHKKENKA